MQVIPLQAIPNQSLFATLGASSIQTQLNIYQKLTGLFMDILLLPATPVVYGALARNMTFACLNSYLGFTGDLAWIDISGAGDNPIYEGLGTQVALLYFEPGEIPTSGFDALFRS